MGVGVELERWYVLSDLKLVLYLRGAAALVPNPNLFPRGSAALVPRRAASLRLNTKTRRPERCNSETTKTCCDEKSTNCHEFCLRGVGHSGGRPTDCGDVPPEMEGANGMHELPDGAGGGGHEGVFGVERQPFQ